MNIAQILRDHADQFPNDNALIDTTGGRSRKTTFGQLEVAAGRTATLLRVAGLFEGDTVLVFCPMSAELYISLAAILRAGMTAMFIDPSAGRRYIDRCCELRPPQALIAVSRAHLLRVASPALRRIPVKFSLGHRIPFTRRLEKAADYDYDPEIHASLGAHPALISFTSGSTGQPKAALRTHGFLRQQHQAIEDNLTLTPGEVELSTLPIFVLANLASRVTSVIAHADLRRPATIAPGPIVSQILEHDVDRSAASPAFYERIVDYCELQNIRLTSLRKIFTGGGPVSPRLLDRLQHAAPRAEITVVYGSTEAEPISTVGFHAMDQSDREAMEQGQGLLAGQPVPTINVRIMNDGWGRAVGPFSASEFDTVCRSPGEAGEIVVHGQHVLSSYLHRQGEEDNKFRVDGLVWHRTGDAGYFDEQGRLWLLGRCAARVDDSRGALYPLGVEQAAMRQPCIRQAAMVAHRGERVLVVTLRNRSQQPDLASLLKALSFANVDSIRIVKRLPLDKRHNAKIDYPALHAMLEQ